MFIVSFPVRGETMEKGTASVIFQTTQKKIRFKRERVEVKQHHISVCRFFAFLVSISLNHIKSIRFLGECFKHPEHTLYTASIQ